MKNCSDWELHKQPAASPARIEQDLMMIKSRTCCCSTEHVAGPGWDQERPGARLTAAGRGGAELCQCVAGMWCLKLWPSWQKPELQPAGDSGDTGPVRPSEWARSRTNFLPACSLRSWHCGQVPGCGHVLDLAWDSALSLLSQSSSLGGSGSGAGTRRDWTCFRRYRQPARVSSRVPQYWHWQMSHNNSRSCPLRTSRNYHT